MGMEFGAPIITLTYGSCTCRPYFTPKEAPCYPFLPEAGLLNADKMIGSLEHLQGPHRELILWVPSLDLCYTFFLTCFFALIMHDPGGI